MFSKTEAQIVQDIPKQQEKHAVHSAAVPHMKNPAPYLKLKRLYNECQALTISPIF
jgi:hypothetical protein